MTSSPRSWLQRIVVRTTAPPSTPSSSTRVKEPSAPGATTSSKRAGLAAASVSSSPARGRMPPDFRKHRDRVGPAVQFDRAVALHDGAGVDVGPHARRQPRRDRPEQRDRVARRGDRHDEQFAAEQELVRDAVRLGELGPRVVEREDERDAGGRRPMVHRMQVRHQAHAQAQRVAERRARLGGEGPRLLREERVVGRVQPEDRASRRRAAPSGR